MGKKKGKRGHYCKGCGAYKPNENFSGKGRRNSICKKCKRAGITPELLNDWDESDEYFAFIAGYTENGAPFGITHEEWEEIEERERNEVKCTVTLQRELAQHLKSISDNNLLEEGIYVALAHYLFITKHISLDDAARLAGRYQDDFLFMMKDYRVPLNLEQTVMEAQYEASIDDLLIQVDKIEGEIE